MENAGPTIAIGKSFPGNAVQFRTGFLQIIYGFIIVLYLFIIIVVSNTIIAKVLQGIVNLILIKKGVYFRLSRVHISIAQLRLKIVGLVLVTKTYSLEIAEVSVRYELGRQVLLQTSKQFDATIQTNIDKSYDFDTKLLKSPLTINVVGFQLHIYNKVANSTMKKGRKKKFSKRRSKKAKEKPVKNIPLFWRLIPAANITGKGARIILGNQHMRLLAVMQIPQFNFIFGMQKLTTQCDPYQAVLDGIIQQVQQQKYEKYFKVSFVENNHVGARSEDQPTNDSQELKKKNFMDIISQMFEIPIIQSNHVRVSVTSVKGGLVEDAHATGFDDDSWPVLQVNIRMHETAIGYSSWHTREIMTMLDYFWPGVVEPEQPVDIGKLVYRINKSVYIGIYFDSECYVMYMNRNCNQPNLPDLNDPIIWWRYKQACMNHRMNNEQQINFFQKLFKGEPPLDQQNNENNKQMQEKESLLFKQLQKKNSKKQCKCYELYSLQYSYMRDMFAQMSPRVPEFQEYFMNIQCIYAKMSTNSQMQIRHVGKFFVTQTEDKPQNIGNKILVRCPCISAKNDLLQQEFCAADDVEVLVDIRKPYNVEDAQSFDLSISARNLQFELNRITMDHILNLVTDFSSQDDIQEVYQHLQMNAFQHMRKKCGRFIPTVTNVRLNVANYEVSCNLQKNNCYTSLHNISEIVPSGQFLMNELVFAKNIKLKDGSKYFNFFSHERLKFSSFHSNFKPQCEVFNSHIQVTAPYQGLEHYDMISQKKKYELFQQIYDDQTVVSEEELCMLHSLRRYEPVSWPRMLLTGTFISAEMETSALQYNKPGVVEPVPGQTHTTFNDRKQQVRISFSAENASAFLQVAKDSFLERVLNTPHNDLKIVQVGTVQLAVTNISTTHTPKEQAYLKIYLRLADVTASLQLFTIGTIVRYVARLMSEYAYYIRPEEAINFNFINNLHQIYKDQMYIDNKKFDVSSHIQKLTKQFEDSNSFQTQVIRQQRNTESSTSQFKSLNRSSMVDDVENDNIFSIQTSNLRIRRNQGGISQYVASSVSPTLVFELNLNRASILASENFLTEVDRQDREPLVSSSKHSLLIQTSSVRVFLLGNNMARKVEISVAPVFIKIGRIFKMSQDQQICKVFYDKYFPRDKDLKTNMSKICTISGALITIEDVMDQNNVFVQTSARQLKVIVPYVNVTIDSTQINHIVQLVLPLLQQARINVANPDFTQEHFKSCVDSIQQIIINPNDNRMPLKPFFSTIINIACAEVVILDNQTEVRHEVSLMNGLNITITDTFDRIFAKNREYQATSALQINVNDIEYKQTEVKDQDHNAYLQTSISINKFSNDNDKIREVHESLCGITDEWVENGLEHDEASSETTYSSGSLMDVNTDIIMQPLDEQHNIFAYSRQQLSVEQDSTSTFQLQHRNCATLRVVDKVRRISSIPVQDNDKENINSLDVRLRYNTNCIINPRGVQKIVQLIKQIQLTRIEDIEDIMSLYYRQWSYKFDGQSVDVVNEKLGESLDSPIRAAPKSRERKQLRCINFVIEQAIMHIKQQTTTAEYINLQLQGLLLQLQSEQNVINHDYKMIRYLDYIDALGQLSAKKLSTTVINNKTYQQLDIIKLILIFNNYGQSSQKQHECDIFLVKNIKQQMQISYAHQGNREHQTQYLHLDMQPLTVNMNIEFFQYACSLLYEFRFWNNPQYKHTAKSINFSLINKSIIQYLNRLNVGDYDEMFNQLFSSAYRSLDKRGLFEKIIRKIDVEETHPERQIIQQLNVIQQQMLQIQNFLHITHGANVASGKRTSSFLGCVQTDMVQICFEDAYSSQIIINPMNVIIDKNKQTQSTLKLVVQHKGISIQISPETIILYLQKLSAAKTTYPRAIHAMTRQKTIAMLQTNVSRQNTAIVQLNKQIQEKQQDSNFIKKILRYINNQKILIQFILQLDYVTCRIQLFQAVSNEDQNQQVSQHLQLAVEQISFYCINQLAHIYSNIYTNLGVNRIMLQYNALQGEDLAIQDIFFNGFNINIKTQEQRSQYNANKLTQLMVYMEFIINEVQAKIDQITKFVPYIVENAALFRIKMNNKRPILQDTNQKLYAESVIEIDNQDKKESIVVLPLFIFNFLIPCIEIKCTLFDQQWFKASLKNLLHHSNFVDWQATIIRGITHLQSGSLQLDGITVQLPALLHEYFLENHVCFTKHQVMFRFPQNIVGHQVFNIIEQLQYRILLCQVLSKDRLSKIKQHCTNQSPPTATGKKRLKITYLLTISSNPIIINLSFPKNELYFGIDQVVFSIQNYDTKQFAHKFLDNHSELYVKNLKLLSKHGKLGNDLSKLDIKTVVQITANTESDMLLAINSNGLMENDINLSVQCNISVNTNNIHGLRHTTIQIDDCSMNVHPKIIYIVRQMNHEIIGGQNLSQMPQRQLFQFLNKQFNRHHSNVHLKAQNSEFEMTVGQISLKLYSLQEVQMLMQVSDISMYMHTIQDYWTQEKCLKTNSNTRVSVGRINLDIVQQKFIKDATTALETSPTNTRLLINMAARYDALSAKGMLNSTVSLLIDNIDIIGDHRSPYQLYLILSYLLLYGQQRVTSSQQRATKVCANEQPIKLSKRGQIEFVNKARSTLKLAITMRLARMTLIFDEKANQCIQFELKQINILLKTEGNDIMNGQGKPAYESREAMDNYLRYMKANDLQYIRIECKQQVNQKVLIVIGPQTFALPQGVFEYVTMVISHFQQSDGGFPSDIRKSFADITGPKRRDIKFRPVNDKIQVDADSYVKQFRRDEKNVLLRSDMLHIVFEASKACDTPAITSILAFQVNNLTFSCMQHGEEIIAYITVTQLKLYACDQTCQTYIDVFSEQTQQSPDFVIPCLLRVDRPLIDFRNSQHRTDVLITVAQVECQIAPVAFEYISTIYNIWKDNIGSIVSQAQEIFKQETEQQGQPSQASKARPLNHTAINVMLHYINACYYKDEYFVIPQIIMSRQVDSVSERDKKMYQLYKIQQKQATNKEYICFNNHSESIVFRGQSSSPRETFILVPNLQLDVHLYENDIKIRLKRGQQYFIQDRQILDNHVRVQSQISINNITVTQFAEYELADMELEGIDLKITRVSNQNTLDTTVRSIKAYVGVRILQQLINIINNIKFGIKQHWGKGVLINNKLNNMGLESYTVVTNAEQIYSDLQSYTSMIQNSQMSTAISTQTSQVTHEQPSGKDCRDNNHNTIFVRIFEGLCPSQFSFSLNNTSIVIGQFNLQDSQLINILLNSIQFKQKITVKQQNSRNQTDAPRNAQEKEERNIGNTLTENVLFDIQELKITTIERNNKVEVSDTSRFYEVNGDRYLFCSDLMNDPHSYISQNVVQINKSQWLIVIENQLQLGKYYVLQTLIDAQTQPGSFQTGPYLLKAIDIVNYIIKDIIVFKNTFKQGKVKVKKRPKRQILDMAVLNQDEPDAVAVLSKIKSKNIQKILPNIDILGQGTGILESLLRQVTSTNSILEGILSKINVFFLRASKRLDDHLQNTGTGEEESSQKYGSDA